MVRKDRLQYANSVLPQIAYQPLYQGTSKTGLVTETFVGVNTLNGASE